MYRHAICLEYSEFPTLQIRNIGSDLRHCKSVTLGLFRCPDVAFKEKNHFLLFLENINESANLLCNLPYVICC